MKLVRQIVFSLILIALAVPAIAWVSPDFRNFLVQRGIWPESTVESASNGKPAGNARRPGREALVVMAPVETGTINDRISAIGSGVAIRTVTVRPQVSGQVESVEVASGSTVKQGDIIAMLDAKSEAIAVDRSRVAMEAAKDKMERFESLLKNRTISSVEVDQARTEMETAELARREAELNLERRMIKAPISGSIGILGINKGDYVTNQSDITTIDDRSQILVEFFVPEKFAGLMVPGTAVSATSVARPGERFSGVIHAVDNRVDQASRTLRVQALIPNKDDLLRSGMSFQVAMQFQGENHPSVDPLAIQWDSSGSYVWGVRDGKAVRIPAAIVQRNADKVLVNAELAPGDMVITEGVQNVRPGAPVRAAGEQGDREKPEKSGEPGAAKPVGS